MRHITIVGVDAAAETVECELADTGERLLLPLDDTFRSAAAGVFPPEASNSPAPAAHPGTDDVPSATTGTTGTARHAPGDVVHLRPRDIQDRVRMGATIDELVEISGYSHARIEAYAYPIVQERAARAEKNRLAHPLLADGPAVATVEDTTIAALAERGIDSELIAWDSWRLKSGNWVVQAAWPAGLSEDATAQWECVPDSHGGVAHPLNDEARVIGDPSLRRPLHAVNKNGTLTGGGELPHDPTARAQPFMIDRPVSLHTTTVEASGGDLRGGATVGARVDSGVGAGAGAGAAAPTGAGDDAGKDDFLMHPPADGGGKARGKHPTMPSWEDVLLGVRSPKD